MTDYRQELRFGTFLTPTAAHADRVLEAAQLSEVVGLDLVSVQDHPYQAAFLDAWTLLSVVAARTSTIRVAPNVANLPLRPPSVLARSVASLDVLSGGRVELGLGTGAFWDAIAALGGPRRSPGEAVEALDEAIDVVRATWDVGGGSVRHRGRHYQVYGAHPGPAPVHPVEIWLGAYKPRMLRLTGAKADGWLPSMGYAAPEALGGMSEVIDEAAAAAGRSPADVRRLYNIDSRFSAATALPDDLAEELAALTLTHGISTFILGTDDLDGIRRFATEVVPAVRELVDGERGRPTPAAAFAPVESIPVSAPNAGPLTVRPTRDDGRRLSAEPAWDESTRPPPPAVDPATTYTAQQQASAQHLVDIHDALRAELAQVRDLLDQVSAGSLDAGAARSAINEMTMRQNNWTLGAYCESYCRIVTSHHTLEDRAMFPQLVRRDPRLGPVVARLEEEHVVIHDVLDAVDRALVALVSEPDGLGRLHEAVDRLTDTMTSHLAYEERVLVEPLARLELFG